MASPFPQQIQIPDQSSPQMGGGGMESPVGPQDASPAQGLDDAIQQIRDIARAAMRDPQATPDIEQTLEKITTLAQGVQATFHKEHQAAMGGGPATNFIRRATGSGGY